MQSFGHVANYYDVTRTNTGLLMGVGNTFGTGALPVSLCLSVSVWQDYPYAWTTDDPELLLNGYYHAPNKLYTQCSAAPGYRLRTIHE